LSDRLSQASRWAALIPLSLVVTAGLIALRLPAALLLGPMLSAIALASRGMQVRIGRPVMFAAQGVVGAMIAENLPLSVFHEAASRWPVFAAGVASTLIAAATLGWLLARSQSLPGTTAIWGTSPGAATVMTLMSESYGADMRLVAFMQYMRVAVCATTATLVARGLGLSTQGGGPDWRAMVAGGWNAAPLGVSLALGGAWLGVLLNLPGGAMLTPMALGMVAKLAWGTAIVLPVPVLGISYALIGWSIGMRFSPEVLTHAARVFPRVLGAIVALVTVCAGFGMVLSRVLGIDPLTAYLATSPGGADSVAIIAAATKVDLPFIMAMQVCRFLFVLLTGPALARWLSRGAR
jgi:uncharacterized protein